MHSKEWVEEVEWVEGKGWEEEEEERVMMVRVLMQRVKWK